MHMRRGVSAAPGLQQPSPRPTTPGPACNWHIHAYAHQPPDRSISIMPSPMHMPPCHPATPPPAPVPVVLGTGAESNPEASPKNPNAHPENARANQPKLG